MELSFKPRPFGMIRNDSGLRAFVANKCIFQKQTTQIAVDLKQILSGFCAFPREKHPKIFSKAGLGDSFCVCFETYNNFNRTKYGLAVSTVAPWRHLLRASGVIIFGKVRCRSWCLARCFFVAGKLLDTQYADVVQTLISLEPIIWVAWGYCQLTGTYTTPLVFQGRRVDFECVFDLLVRRQTFSPPQQSCELHQIQIGNIFNGSVCLVFFSSPGTI